MRGCEMRYFWMYLFMYGWLYWIIFHSPVWYKNFILLYKYFWQYKTHLNYCDYGIKPQISDYSALSFLLQTINVSMPKYKQTDFNNQVYFNFFAKSWWCCMNFERFSVLKYHAMFSCFLLEIVLFCHLIWKFLLSAFLWLW